MGISLRDQRGGQLGPGRRGDIHDLDPAGAVGDIGIVPGNRDALGRAVRIEGPDQGEPGRIGDVDDLEAGAAVGQEENISPENDPGRLAGGIPGAGDLRGRGIRDVDGQQSPGSVGHEGRGSGDRDVPGLAGSIKDALQNRRLRVGDVDHGQALVGRGHQGEVSGQSDGEPAAEMDLGERFRVPGIGQVQDREAVEEGAVSQIAPDLDVVGFRPEGRAEKGQPAALPRRRRPGRRAKTGSGPIQPADGISIWTCSSSGPALRSGCRRASPA